MTLSASTSWIFWRINRESYGRGLSEYEACKLLANLVGLLIGNGSMIAYYWVRFLAFEKDCQEVSTVRYMWCHNPPWLLHSVAVGLWLNALACAFLILSIAMLAINFILQIRKRRFKK